ncbi:cation:proton antiporter subunit C [Corynebacterium uterequi]|uniref:Multisubunit Na+/H+ antiporter, MnhC subunit n=2 Tax=Corynebacterium uterequi TaxID=1072256 RepID=A0A0G3HA43_9CORY|nr:cation:proton antiporter subunit C [Corynebacterium uterequi]AKK10179.1 multisubunit Na+/H+ antiporter, MnhC subunit [Corynebacterium uterequi]
MVMALTISVLAAGAVYLMFQRGLVRIIFAMSLLGHASNLMLLATGVGAWRGETFFGTRDLAVAGDPLPQAFVLTAVVISMATTTLLLATSALGVDDDTDDKLVSPEGPDIADGTPDVHEWADPFSTLGRDRIRQEVLHDSLNS